VTEMDAVTGWLNGIDYISTFVLSKIKTSNFQFH